MKSIEQRTNGEYVPSPGTIYPTLQLLEDEGLIRAEQQADRRVYQLSEAGQAEVEKEAGRIQCFWKKFTAPQPSEAVRQELEFLHDELDSLQRTFWGSLRESIESGDSNTIRRMRQLVQRHHEEIRDFIVTTNSNREAE
jgi:DNA-binding PadR family transcriptional regulator